ncbi:hypothetical protein [Erythrobacter longus]|uniref:hypothetical protein n=1 Tax=Erythrobacter longus TaxID=1044 RepID=UPI000AA5F5EC|nr:hypothetical protein [Erythrobacter longus]
MLEALTAIVFVIASGNVAATAVSDTQADNPASVQADRAADTAQDSRTARIARMRAKMRSSGPRASRVRCAHEACDPCEAGGSNTPQNAQASRSQVAVSNRASTQPTSCDTPTA